MSDAPHQPHRRGRLLALLNHADFGGNKIELARALGFKSGAFVHQMLSGIRPILEKTIDKVHAIKGGKYRGWFDAAPDLPVAARLAEPPPAPAQAPEAPPLGKTAVRGLFFVLRKKTEAIAIA